MGSKRIRVTILSFLFILGAAGGALAQTEFPAANAHGYLDIFQALESSSLHELTKEDLKRIDECVKERAFFKLRIPKGTVLQEDLVIPSCFEKDPYAHYETPAKRKIAAEERAGKFYGIGISIAPTDNGIGVRVEGVAPEGTAAKDGRLKKDDVIIAIGEESKSLQPLEGLSFTEVVRLIRGKSSSKVVLEILRGDQKMVIAIARGEVKIKSTEERILESNIGYLKIFSFSEKELVLEEVIPPLRKFYTSGITALVVDLRGNPGGLLSTSLIFLELFSPGKGTPTVEVRERKISPQNDGGGNREAQMDGVTSFRTEADGVVADWKVVVLVDQYSASASEIVAGVLKRWGAKVFGTRTYGKGSVQTEIPVSDGGVFSLTTARYHFVDGISPEGEGITPDDIETTKELISDQKTGAISVIDHPLNRAVEYLRKELKKESETH